MNSVADTMSVQDLKGVFDSTSYILLFIALLAVVYIFMRIQQRRRLDRMRDRHHRRRLLR
jgi:preprotein translocase subunit YajC